MDSHLSSAPVIERIKARVVGRENELELVLAAVESGRDLILEGPPGTSKTTILKAITAEWGIPLLTVEGNVELTPARLLGYHDPARVLREGYGEDTFEPGPLLEAMRSGGFLYFEEFNRAPDDTLNTLLTAIADREVSVPRLGVVSALPSFRLVGSMNPYDNVGTTRLSVSIRDRLCRLEIDYQPEEAEREVVARRCAVDGEPGLERRLLEDAVAVTRATREHDAVVQGSSVRGAIDLQLLGARLCALRSIEDADDERYPGCFLEAMLIALSGRMLLDQAAGVEAKTVLREIWENRFLLAGRLPGDGGETELSDPSPIERDSAAAKRGGRRAGKPKTLSEDPNLITSSGGQGLAASRQRQRIAGAARRLPADGSSVGEERGEIDDGEPPPAAESGAARAAAQSVAARLATRPPQLRTRRRGGGEVRSARFDGAGEIDLDHSFDAIAERRPLLAEDLQVRDRRARARALLLAVDVSGSMRGERLRTAAAAVGALSAEFSRERFAVLAFWSDAAFLQRFGERPGLAELVDAMIGLSASGLTNVCFPLEVAAAELAASGQAEQRVLLLSDCVHNAGPDPRLAAATLPRLDILLETSGECDPDLARDLARQGRGHVRPIRDYRDIAFAANELFSP